MAAGGWIGDVLTFWFEELTPEQWFTVDQALDQTIRERFRPLHERLASALPEETDTDAEAALAAIIVLDQFSRNIFRGTAKAFAFDPLALGLSRNAIEKNFDDGLGAQHRQFLYMPLMHSENMADQEESVRQYRSLGDENAFKFAEEHRDIIARFGRFPHRNKVLSRTSTEAEIAFLAEANSYGQ